MTRANMDIATTLGLAVGFLLLAAAILLGGSPFAFVDLPSVLIVVGGTFAVTMISFSLEEMIRAQSVLLQTLIDRRNTPNAAARAVLRLADTARKSGVLSLQALVPQLRGQSFLQRAVQLAVDGLPEPEINRILHQEGQAKQIRHAHSASVLRRAAEVAPAMGLIGTLLGLVQMLGNLSDPASIGPSMALALLTTFYGAVLANMVFLPLASKLERNSEAEALLDTIYLTAALSIARQDNPRKLEIELNAILPPGERVRIFD